VTGLAPLFGLIALIALGGLFAAIDAAVSTVSMARVEELVRDEKPGAVRLARLLVDRPRYINLVVLLRIACEASATVLLVSYIYDDIGLTWGLIAAAAGAAGAQPRRCSAPCPVSSASSWPRL
jgi:CBS domain containing-hemolysin-like protein